MADDTQKILALLSHPVRVQLIEMLAKRALKTDVMAQKLPVTRGGLLSHLNQLVSEGLIHAQREGVRVDYWLNRERLVGALADFGREVGIRVTLDSSFVQRVPAGAAKKKKAASKKAAPKKKARKR